ncbi:unnamed protein product [Allacma fusca]|uniref:Uncharacterized protein n=1 Tax=Allacma fusca TaxID=39272 RepID=A0A8J2JH05_9HEXA|nr:unnamed protein product [Allacma fusca]
MMERRSILSPAIPVKPISPEKLLKYKTQGKINREYGSNFGGSNVYLPTAAFINLRICFLVPQLQHEMTKAGQVSFIKIQLQPKSRVASDLHAVDGILEDVLTDQVMIGYIEDSVIALPNHASGIDAGIQPLVGADAGEPGSQPELTRQQLRSQRRSLVRKTEYGR